MAKFNSKGNLIGLIGKIVTYEVNGKLYARGKPRAYRRKSKKVKSANKMFGLVSTHASNIARCLSHLFLFKFTRDTYNGIRGWIYKYYKLNFESVQWDISTTDSFCQLNPLADIRVLYDLKLELEDIGEGKIRITIPPLNPLKDLVIPNCFLINLKFIVAQNELDEKMWALRPLVSQYEFSVYQPFHGDQVTIQCEHKPGELVVVAVAIEYIISGNPSREVHKDIAFHPGAVIGIGKLK